MEIISTIIIGAIAGWLGSLIFKGTGLGLNISVAIFKEHGFQMFVEKLEVGTMIKVKIR